MYEFWYDYVKPKYKGKSKLCWLDTSNSIKTEGIYTDIPKDVETSLMLQKIKKSNSVHERWIRWENNERNFCIKDTKECFVKRKLRLKTIKIVK